MQYRSGISPFAVLKVGRIYYSAIVYVELVEFLQGGKYSAMTEDVVSKCRSCPVFFVAFVTMWSAVGGGGSHGGARTQCSTKRGQGFISLYPSITLDLLRPIVKRVSIVIACELSAPASTNRVSRIGLDHHLLSTGTMNSTVDQVGPDLSSYGHCRTLTSG